MSCRIIFSPSKERTVDTMAQEHSTPQKIEWAESANLTDILEKQRKECPDRVLYRFKRDAGWEPITAEQFHE